MTPCELDEPQENGVDELVFEEGGERGLSANPEEAEGCDCDTTEGEGAKDGSSSNLQVEQGAERALNLETLEEEQTSECGPAEPVYGGDLAQEGQEKDETKEEN